MEEIRCPMCGKPNPAEEEICQYCEARLKPLIVSPFSEDIDGADAEMPVWLRDELDDKTESLGKAATPPEESSTPQEADDEDDWLNQLRPQDSDAEFAPAETDEPSSPKTTGSLYDEPLPDWLTTSSDEQPPTEESPTLNDEGEELPDWLKAPVDSEPAESPEEEPALPDWMTAAEEPESPIAPPPDADLPEWVTEEPQTTAAPDEDIPDWIAEVQDEEAEIPIILPDAEPETPDWPGMQPESEEAEPDWVARLGGEAAAEETFALEDIQPLDEKLLPEDDLFELEELNELFNDFDKEPDPPATLDEDLAPTELPDWLEAMRPVETSEAEDQLEDAEPPVQTGPLAGLRRVLKAEPEIARLKKATPLPSRLQASEVQRQHARLLHELIETEGETKPLKQQSIPLSSQNLFRWVVTVLLLLAVGAAVFSESQLIPSLPPSAVPAEVLRTSELIESLEPRSQVLVAFDYEPGTSGEMQAAAAALMDHVMLKGAYLTLVSTSPTGPALAHEFITRLEAAHQYETGVHFVNLGYIPGGASGLLSFTQTPRRITPMSYDGLDAWALPPLQGIATLGDFDMLILISDNAETARTWIEQVQPTIPETPLILVASAQAEPALRLYASGASPQVDGFVGGVFGGAAYEQVTGKDNLARRYWDALNIGLIAAVAAIFFGGLVNAAAIFFRNKEPSQAS